MTNPGSHEGRTDEPTLEERVIAMFHESRKVLGSGNEKFPALSEKNPHDQSVKEAVGELAVDQLIELVATGESEELKDVASAWAEYQVAKRLHNEAYSAYVESQNEALTAMLKDKRITVTARPNDSWSPISPSDGAFTTSGSSNPTEVSGSFLHADVNVGQLILAMDVRQPNGDKYWVVSVMSSSLGGEELEQKVDLKIENPEVPEAA